MRRIDATIGTVLTLALAAAGCAAEGDDGSAAETRTSTQLLEGEVEGDEGNSAPATFGYDEADGWHFRVGQEGTGFNSESDYRTASRTLGHDGGSLIDAGNSGGNDEPGGGLGSGGSSESSGASLSGASGATVRYSGAGTQGSRYSGSAQVDSRYEGSSGASVRFSGSASVSFSGQCRPTALCDLAETACEMGEEYSSGVVIDGCSQSELARCRSDVRRDYNESDSAGKAFICFFSVYAECVNQGLRQAGAISTEEGYQRAVASGLRGCFDESSGSASFEFEASF